MQDDQVLKPDPEDLKFGNRDFQSASYHAFSARDEESGGTIEYIHQVFKRIADGTHWKVCRRNGKIVEFSQTKKLNGAFVPMEREEP